jgi:threonine dehydratase
MRTVEVPGPEQFERAEAVVRANLPVTPVVASPLLGADVVLKLETLQPTGAFKVRGGLASVAASLAGDTTTPLVTASAGNHGLGVAFAAERLGAHATVVVAETASEAKVQALERFGVRLVRHGRTYDEAEAWAIDLAAQQGGRYVSPYNDPDVIAGQGTIGTELLAQVPGLATVVVPVGGGGLLSGIGMTTAAAGVRLVGVEPEQSTAMSAALAAGSVVPVPVGPTLADGLAGNLEPGSVTVDLAQKYASELVAVSEGEIEAAIRFLAFEHGIVAEGSAAVPVAAVRSGKVDLGAGPAAVVVTGRNITPTLLASVLASS